MSTYKNIAKSTGIVAFVQIFQMLFSFARNKVIAVLLGTATFGIYSIYNTFIEMSSTFAIFGLNNSGVREIARCKGDREKIGKVYYTLNRLILFTAITACVLIIIFAEEIGLYLFNEEGHTTGIYIVAGIILVSVFAKEGYAIINGIRNLHDLAISQILSSGIGSIGVIVSIVLWRDSAIPAALGIIYLAMALITFYYVKKNDVKEVRLTYQEFKSQSKSLLNIGLGVTIAGLVSSLMTIMAKSYLSRYFDMSAVGLYQASWTISNLYIGIVLSSMGIDFMPRVSSIANDKNKVNELIDQQTIFGIVVASIGITGILLLSKEILIILYSSAFTGADIIIRWHVLGVFLRVIAFPLSYSILALGLAKHYAIIEVIFWVGDYLLLILFSRLFGFNGLGVDYLVAYIGFLLMCFLVIKKKTGYIQSKEQLKVCCISCVFIVVAWIVSFLNLRNLFLRYGIDALILTLQTIYINDYLKKKMDINLIHYITSKFHKNHNEQ